MVAAIPPASVVEAFAAPSTRHFRRVEIHEKDGVTRWFRDTDSRLVEGSVTLDYSREEMRHFDLVLDNTDGVLANKPNEFWYDKIIKLFRGVKLPERRKTIPSILVYLGEPVGTAGQDSDLIRGILTALGFSDVTIRYDEAGAVDDASRYDVIILFSEDANIVASVQEYVLGGGSVFVDHRNAARFVRLVSGDDTVTSDIQTLGDTYEIFAVPGSLHPAAQSWGPFHSAGLLWELGLDPSIMRSKGFTSIGLSEAYPHPNVPYAETIWVGGRESSGGRVGMILTQCALGVWDQPGFKNMMAAMLLWLGEDLRLTEWEVQVGEFMIDRIRENNFPRQIAITGRDYTKKCLAAKFEAATQFDPGLYLEVLIRNLAANSGVTKFNLPPTGITVNKSFYYERGVTRWEAMKEIATAYAYDVYFDATGFLRLRKQQDPTTTPASFEVKGGQDGTMIGYEKSTTDTRIYNHIVVTGESSDAEVLPVYAVARNDNPASPTSTVNLGVRTYTYTSSFITTEAQAQAVADNFLTLHALEEYELNFDILLAPWLEVGDIITWQDPRPADDDPRTYLLSSLTIPMGLAGMSGAGKRVIKVEQP